MANRENFNQRADRLLDGLRRHQVATDRIYEAASRALGLNRTDSRCLDIIQRREPLSAGELATEAGLTTGAVTSVIDRLELADYVRRVPDPGDRRRVLIEQTAHARETVQRLWGPSWAPFLEILEGFTAEELDAVIRFIDLQNELGEWMSEQLDLQPRPGTPRRPR